MCYCCALAIVTGSSSNNILNFKLVRLGGHMVKLCHEKMQILRSVLPSPPQKIEPPPEKNLTSHPWKISNTLTRNSTHWE